MLDVGWSEMLVIGIVALVVIGPKDLPVMFKTLGRFTARARSMAREFQRAMEQAADDSGIKDVASDLKQAASPATTGMDKLKDAATKFEQWNPTKPVSSAAKMAVGAAIATPAVAAATPVAPATPAVATTTTPAATTTTPAAAVAPVPAGGTPPARPAAVVTPAEPAEAGPSMGQTLAGAAATAALGAGVSLLPEAFGGDASDEEEQA